MILHDQEFIHPLLEGENSPSSSDQSTIRVFKRQVLFI